MSGSALAVATEVQQTLPAVLSVGQVVANVRLIQEVMGAVMKEGTHYGVIPGCNKPSLWKPGAEVLGVTFRIATSYTTEDLSTDDVVRYRVRCIGTHQTTGIVMGEGMGECSSNEEKYKWRKATNKEWENTPEHRRRVKYGYSRDRGEYQIKQVRTEPADLANTILKMACKRAQVAMAINVTGASDIFTQDIEDLPEEYVGEIADDETTAKTTIKQPREKNEPAPTSQEPAKEQKNPAPDNSGPLKPGMVNVIKAKITAAALGEAELFKQFGVTSWDGLKASQANSILDWIKNPNGA